MLFVVPVERRYLISLRQIFFSVVFDFVVVRVGGTHAKRVRIVELLECVDASTYSKYSGGRCRELRAALVLKWVATLVRVRFTDVRASNFFEFLSRVMRCLLAVPFGIR